MALGKTTKSVLFYKGMTDDTDRFLAKSPAVDYTENLYEERNGAYSKRPGFEDLTNGLPVHSDTDGDPFMLHAVRDTLYTMGVDKGYYYDGGAAWGEVENNGDIGVRNLEIPVRTQSSYGAVSYTTCMSRDGLYYCVAFSTKNEGVYETVIQSYALDGTFRGEQRVASSIDPQIFIGEDNPVHFYSFNTNGLGTVEHRFYDPATNTFTAGPSSIVQCSSVGNWSFDGGTEAPDAASARVGFSSARSEAVSAQYQIDFVEDGTSGVILYTDALDGNLKIWLLNGSGVRSGSDVTISSTQPMSPLAVTVSSDNSSFALMYVARETIPSGVPYSHATVVIVQRRSLASIGTLDWNEALIADSEPTPGTGFADYYGHGSLAFNDATNNVLVAYHVAPGEETLFGEFGFVGDSDGSRLRYVELDDSDDGTPTGFGGTLQSQRLASRLASDGGKYYAVLQQWSVFTPRITGSSGEGATVVPNTFIPPKSKPVSSVLCELLDGSEVGIIGVFGANASRRCNPTSDETTVQLPKLVVLESNKFMHINRQILIQEDILYTIHSVSTRQAEAFGRLSPPEAMGALNIVDSNMADTRSVSFGNGIFVGSAAPVWMTGTSLSEAYVIDRPEIVGIETSGTFQSSVFWENVLVAVTPPTVLRRAQVVVGYVDSGGNRHRSAPSAMAWISFTSEELDERDLKVYFTPPISAFSGRRDYFAELYLSVTDSDTLKLAGATSIDVRDSSEWSDFFIEVDMTIEYTSDPNLGFAPTRSSPNVYTEGGGLASIAWPSIKDIAVASRRAWLISKQYPGSVFYTKLFEESVSPEFAGELIIPLGEERDLTCIGILDDKAVVFEKNDIHIIFGDGPDNRGRGQDFAVEYITTGAIGCEDPKSVIETPAGLMFYNRARGFHLLDRNRQLQFIGAGVKDLSKDLTVHAATVDPRESEVRFLVTSDNPVDSDGPSADTTRVDRPPTPWFGNSLPWRNGTCLSYNYESGIWTMFTNYYGQASTLYQDRYTRIFSDYPYEVYPPVVPANDGNWTVWKESADEWTDPVGTNRTLMRSHWIELGQQVQDYQRLWKITFLGRYLSSLQDLGGGPTIPGGGPYVYDVKVGTGGGFGVGEVRFNDTNLIDAWTCRVKDIDGNGVDQTAFLDGLVGYRIRVVSDEGNGLIFTCSEATHVSSYYDLDILAGSSTVVGGPLTDGDNLTVSASEGIYEAGDVKVSLYFDYEKEPSQVETFKFQDFGFDPFQNPQERTERFQFEMYPVRGRCQSVKIEIEEVNSESVAEGLTYALGRGFEIVSADFEIGVGDQQSTRFLGHGARR